MREEVAEERVDQVGLEVGGWVSAWDPSKGALAAYGMNLGRMLVRMKVREWNKEKVANGIMDTVHLASLVA